MTQNIMRQVNTCSETEKCPNFHKINIWLFVTIHCNTELYTISLKEKN